METPVKTPNSSGHYHGDNVLSTPLFVPPTPMLKELGYGTGKFSNIRFYLQFIDSKCIHIDKIVFFCLSNLPGA